MRQWWQTEAPAITLRRALAAGTDEGANIGPKARPCSYLTKQYRPACFHADRAEKESKQRLYIPPAYDVEGAVRDLHRPYDGRIGGVYLKHSA